MNPRGSASPIPGGASEDTVGQGTPYGVSLKLHPRWLLVCARLTSAWGPAQQGGAGLTAAWETGEMDEQAG
jgi:hypothetical protein